MSALPYLSYLLQRYLPHRGALVPAILGGACSSTATTVALAREQRASEAPRPEMTVGIVMATAFRYLLIDLAVALFNRPLALLLLPRVAALSALAAAIAVWQWRHREQVSPLRCGGAAGDESAATSGGSHFSGTVCARGAGLELSS